MNEIIVKTQEELDNVPLDYHGRIIIKFGTAFNPAILKKPYDYASAELWIGRASGSERVSGVV